MCKRIQQYCRLILTFKFYTHMSVYHNITYNMGKLMETMLYLGGSLRSARFPCSSLYMMSVRPPDVVWAVEVEGASLKNMLAANEGRSFSLSLVVSLKRL